MPFSDYSLLTCTYRDSNDLIIIPGAEKKEESKEKTPTPSYKEVSQNCRRSKYVKYQPISLANKIHVEEKEKKVGEIYCKRKRTIPIYFESNFL